MKNQWLPQFQPTQLKDAPVQLCYEIKTLLVTAQIQFTLGGATDSPEVVLDAKLKIPLKGKIDFQAQSRLEKIAVSKQTTVWFKTFSESGVLGRRGNQWVASKDEGLRVNDAAIATANCLQTLVCVMQAPYLFWNAAKDTDTFYLGFLVGTTQQAIRLRKIDEQKQTETYEVRALPLRGNEENVSELNWSQGYPAQIQVKDGILDSVEVTVPVAGRLVLKRKL